MKVNKEVELARDDFPNCGDCIFADWVAKDNVYCDLHEFETPSPKWGCKDHDQLDYPD